MTIKTALSSFAVALLFCAPAVAQYDDSDAFSGPKTRTSAYADADKSAFSGTPSLNYVFRHYDNDECALAISRVVLEAPSGGHDWPSSARLALCDANTLIAGAAPAVAVAVNTKHETGRNIELRVQFFDQARTAVIPPAVQLYDLDREPIPFELREIHTSKVPGHYYFLIDVSGSMKGHRALIAKRIQAFADNIPGEKRCHLLFFNSEAALMQAKPGEEGSCEPQHLGPLIDQLVYDGRTDIYGALHKAFEQIDINADPNVEGNSLVLLFTDGHQQTQVSKSRILNAKNAPVFAYWFGDFNASILDGIAEFENYSSSDFSAIDLEEFLKVTGNAIATQLVISFEKPR